jgi:hypothetical protein
MKILHLAGKTVLTAAFILAMVSCSTTGTQVPQRADDLTPHFTDEASVNAVLQFSSWEYTFLIRPQYSEHGFLQQVHREDIGTVFDQLNVKRGTVVVIVGWTYNGELLTQVVSDWKTILGGCGFQRVVVLRAQLGDKLNGSVIVDDSILHIGSVESPTRGG